MHYITSLNIFKLTVIVNIREKKDENIFYVIYLLVYLFITVIIIFGFQKLFSLYEQCIVFNYVELCR